ncbi:uncharacterized protein GGS22DRAFT_141491 [Annulohypoxylon maeteangense]|uniref:uncharacterized protein n=1 Tax=Annulohypoxylon maeteangense TaxID=1927788 RepID=UPI002007922B|nr:uncharacterized protein GGS22DRAFT_141491 [Annulohypoxylon maeteangense]KAI0885271.1 hypothetical protein GGS22DRAFT_141491 [Annulohypoxylon maeteangense]
MQVYQIGLMQATITSAPRFEREALTYRKDSPPDSIHDASTSLSRNLKEKLTMLFRTARQLAPLRTFTTRRTTLPQSTQLQRTWARFSSSQTPSSPQAPSPNSQFYKTFGRPIAKVFLLAILTYQFAYYGWVRLEHGEIKSEMRAAIADLEARIEQLENARKV